VRRIAALLVPVTLLLGACSGGSGSGGSAAALPTVSGAYGEKPTLTFPSGKPSKTLEKKVLSEGAGTPIEKGDLMVADYLGQVYNGKIFDQSFDRDRPISTPVGLGKVIAGWDEGLVGVKAGSRVLLVVPPDKGYKGSAPSADIKADDTLVFVIDVLQRYGETASGDPKAARQQVSTAGVKVGGELGSRPTVSVPKGTPVPTKMRAIVLARGSGKPVTGGVVVIQFAPVNWDNKQLTSTWASTSPAAVPLGDKSKTPFDTLIGLPIGSRVLVLVPPTDKKQTGNAVAAVIDIVDQPKTAKSTAK
jgi:peptidylprolyl isomerase